MPPAEKKARPVKKETKGPIKPALKMRPPPQHLAPHLKTKIKNVLFPYKDALSEKQWKAMDKHLIKEGVYDMDGKYAVHPSRHERERNYTNSRKMIPGTTVHFVQEAIRLKVNITADHHGEYKPNREQLESAF